ncbi:TRAP transporter substrate-binding protein [Aliiruegeria lutimaris]|uniref:TRAP-type C4-dicarboxylate transport system, substrate-binding protein n=1 Tax=Aliiruegeria lutimaris TaxID=571298 RepID=A0A1G9KUH3_9RHOB|nr:TRAP transporter substrate-binding protein [Aliiruegeria lutimaris]SDL53147.1 TRAP-type C4-dicarboxylate transport system, substrate-binding protein [Aliiruegeria lutimaris]
MIRRSLIASATAVALATSLLPGLAAAQEVTLRLHQFLPPPATVPKHILKPWASRVEEASGGKVKIEHFDAMSLGGKPPELMDQAIDGVADIIMTVVGYTPGRFPRTEVFELPFMMTDPVATSMAYQEMVEADLQANEYKDVKVLGAWVHGPGVIHASRPIETVEDMEGLKVRGPTRVINDLLNELGATPVGLPLPAIPEALSKNVVSGTVIPWEVTPAIKLTELVTNHTEFTGEEALYTATIVLVMNKAKYESLPDDIRAAIDAESGLNLSKFAAEVMWEFDAPGRAIAEKAGNNIIQLPEEEVARFKEKAQPVIDRWVAEMEEAGIDGKQLISDAKALIKKNGG